ncbi:MAG: NAD(P)H-dependent oxidoreductase subunit E [Candidatus Poribacteria bacterium]
MELNMIDAIVGQHKRKSWALISILQDIQKEDGYLSSDVLKRVSEKMEIPLTRLYGVATFYKTLNLIPQGKHAITICAGTACHVRGSNRILNEIRGLLKVEPGETTEDGEFTLNVVNCLGACAIGPVVVVDGKYHGKMSASKVKDLLAKFRS